MRQLHREFLRAGANVMQTFTFYASDDKLENRGNTQRFTVSEGRSCCTVRGWQGPRMNLELVPDEYKALFVCFSVLHL